MVTTTQHYDVRREGSADFAKVPVDGSSKMPNTHMDAIEPFDYGDLKPFSTAYLPGYLADRYDEDADACAERAYRRMYNSTADALHATTGGYSEIHPISENINVDMTHAHYALLPVWMLHTRWKDKDFLFAMNGQTGRLIGDLPVDKSRVAAWFAGISCPDGSAGVPAVVIRGWQNETHCKTLCRPAGRTGAGALPEHSRLCRRALVRDEMGLFDADTYSQLEASAEAASDGHDCDVYFLVVDSIGDTDQRQYAKDYYLANGLGSGSEQSGILFLLAVGSRKYVTITYGGGVTAFTDYRIEQIEDAVVPYLSDNDWAEAASEYLSMCADTLDFYAEHGEPLDVDNDTSGWPILLLIVIGVPMIIAGIVCGVLYSQMKTARLKTEANDYIGAGLKLRVQVDNYTHTDRVQVYDPPHEESSSSGGSSVDSDGFGGSSGGSF